MAKSIFGRTESNTVKKLSGRKCQKAKTLLTIMVVNFYGIPAIIEAY